MTDLLTRPLLRRDEPARGSMASWLAAVLAAGWTLVAGFAMSAVPGVAVWLAGGVATPMSDPLRFGARVWLASHRVGLDLGDGAFTVAPLGLTLVFVLLLFRSARWAAHMAAVGTGRGLAVLVVSMALTYALGAGAVAGMSATGDVSAVPLAAVGWAGLWAAGATVTAVAVESGVLAHWVDGVPPWLRFACWSAAGALAVLLGVGALLVAVSAAASAERIGELAVALDAGPVGATVLAAAGAAIVPNAVVWALCYALGPGFAFGVGTSVSPAGVELGLVPALPALAALPVEHPGPLMWLVLAGPVLAGVAAAVIGWRRATPELRAAPLWSGTGAAIVVAGALVAAGVTGLAWLSGGSAGAGRMSEIGPEAWQAGLACLGLVAVPAFVTLALVRWRWSDHR